MAFIRKVQSSRMKNLGTEQLHMEGINRDSSLTGGVLGGFCKSWDRCSSTEVSTEVSTKSLLIKSANDADWWSGR